MRHRHFYLGTLLGVGALALGGIAPVLAHEPAAASRPRALRSVRFDQRLNEPVPLDLLFRDEAGRSVRLGEYFGKKPVVLVPVYYRCRNLCPLVLDGLVRALRAVSFNVGDHFEVLTVSIDPRDGPAEATAKKEQIVPRYGRPGAAEGWHFLTGDEPSIQRLTEALGFGYTYEAQEDQYAHASGIVILTLQGRVARYFYGIEYSPRDLRLGLVEASANKIGSPVDQLLLFCYHYDPATGKYTLAVMNVLRGAGLATALALGVFIVVMSRRNRRQAIDVDHRGAAMPVRLALESLPGEHRD